MYYLFRRSAHSLSSLAWEWALNRSYIVNHSRSICTIVILWCQLALPAVMEMRRSMELTLLTSVSLVTVNARRRQVWCRNFFIWKTERSKYKPQYALTQYAFWRLHGEIWFKDRQHIMKCDWDSCGFAEQYRGVYGISIMIRIALTHPRYYQSRNITTNATNMGIIIAVRTNPGWFTRTPALHPHRSTFILTFGRTSFQQSVSSLSRVIKKQEW